MSGGAGSRRFLRRVAPLVAALTVGLVAGCQAREPEAQSAEQLLADPARLDAVQQGCRTNQPWATDALCRAAAEAIRLRFRGEGARYTPHEVEPFPSQPAPEPKPELTSGDDLSAGRAERRDAQDIER